MPGEPPAPLAVAVDHLAELAPNGVPDATAKTPTVGAAYLGHETPHSPARRIVEPMVPPTVGADWRRKDAVRSAIVPWQTYGRDVRELPVLDATDQRILGSLLEKQTTVPATYPLSANALVSACNQRSSRDPVTDLDQQTVERTAKSLKERGLLRIVWSDTGRRTLKYHQILDEHLALEPDERALLTVLLLRGAQAPGELRTRTERLHGFADRGQVEDCLRRMASRPQPLVCELERRSGQQDPRWIHLLGAEPAQTSGETSPAGSADTSRIRVTQIIADLHVPDLPASRSFYSDYLGLAEEEFNLGWVARHTSPASRAALQVMTSDATAPVDPVVSVMVDDVEAAYRQAQERGYEIVHPLTTETWGVTRFFVRAPDGNVLNVGQQHAS